MAWDVDRPWRKDEECRAAQVETDAILALSLGVTAEVWSASTSIRLGSWTERQICGRLTRGSRGWFRVDNSGRQRV